MNPLISIIPNVKVKGVSVSGNKYLDQILSEIVNGQHKLIVERIQKLIYDGKIEEAAKLKITLPAFAPSGVFVIGRKKENLSVFSRIIILDYDKINPEFYDQKFAQVCSLNTTLGCFRSPSGNGIKVLVPISKDQEDFECSFMQVAEFYSEQLRIPIDNSGKDISRLCFFSYDPNLYMNLECEVFQIAPCPEVIEVEKEIQSPTESDLTIYEVHSKFNKAEIHTKRIITFKEGYRNNFVFLLACNCCRSGIPLLDAQNLILSEYDYDKDEITTTIASAYRNESGKKVVFQKDSLFSINLLNFKRYKTNIPFDERIMFEAMLIKMLAFNGIFYLTGEMIRQELGIKRTRAERIIKRFIEIGFISKMKITSQIENEPRQKNFYEVIPEKIVETSILMFIDNKEFVKRISHLLVGFIDSRLKEH